MTLEQWNRASLHHDALVICLFAVVVLVLVALVWYRD